MLCTLRNVREKLLLSFRSYPNNIISSAFNRWTCKMAESVCDSPLGQSCFRRICWIQPSLRMLCSVPKVIYGWFLGLSQLINCPLLPVTTVIFKTWAFCIIPNANASEGYFASKCRHTLCCHAYCICTAVTLDSFIKIYANCLQAKEWYPNILHTTMRNSTSSSQPNASQCGKFA